MVADNQPMTHPLNSSRNVRRMALSADTDAATRIAAQTTAQPMLYPV
jgi:hypothetical protein